MINAGWAIIVGIIVAAVSSWITVQLSLRKFRTEKWWELKAEAYSKIIGALHNSKAFADEHLNAHNRGYKISEEKEKEVRRRANEAKEKISKAVDIGAFLLSERALARLKQYQKDAQAGAEDWYKSLEKDWEVSHKCLKDIIEIAKIDLQTK